MEDDLRTSQLIRDMSAHERPREKALNSGFKSLSDAELLALLFATGIRGKSVIELSEDILRDNRGHLSKLTSMRVTEICRRYKGIGPAKAITLLAALELGLRAAADGARISEPLVNDPDTAYRVMSPRLQHLDHEEFWVLYLSRSGKILRESRIGQGGTCATVVDVKIVLQGALETLSDAIMLFHNHPSGSLVPSTEDRKLTERIRSGADIFGIRVLDHIIVTDNGYYSFHSSGDIL